MILARSGTSVLNVVSVKASRAINPGKACCNVVNDGTRLTKAVQDDVKGGFYLEPVPGQQSRRSVLSPVRTRGPTLDVTTVKAPPAFKSAKRPAFNPTPVRVQQVPQPFKPSLPYYINAPQVLPERRYDSSSLNTNSGPSLRVDSAPPTSCGDGHCADKLCRPSPIRTLRRSLMRLVPETVLSRPTVPASVASPTTASTSSSKSGFLNQRTSKKPFNPKLPPKRSKTNP